MITSARVTMLGWITVGILVILLVLVWTGSVDASMRIPILIFAAILVISRMILRLIVQRRGRGGDKGKTREERV